MLHPSWRGVVNRVRGSLRALVVTLLLFVVGGCVDRNSPRHAAEQILSAVREQDHLRLEAFVDQDRLAAHLVDQANEEAIARARESTLGRERDLYVGMGLGRAGQVEVMRVTVREVLARLVDSERERTREEKHVIDRIRIGDVRQAEHVADVEIQIARTGARDPVRLIARLEWSGNAWRLVGLRGLAALTNVPEITVLSRLVSGPLGH